MVFLQGSEKVLGATVSLNSDYHPQCNGQSKSANIYLESAIPCIAATNPSLWSTHLSWVKCCTTGLSHFEASLSYQPPSTLVPGRGYSGYVSAGIHPFNPSAVDPTWIHNDPSHFPCFSVKTYLHQPLFPTFCHKGWGLKYLGPIGRGMILRNASRCLISLYCSLTWLPSFIGIDLICPMGRQEALIEGEDRDITRHGKVFKKNLPHAKSLVKITNLKSWKDQISTWPFNNKRYNELDYNYVTL